MRVFVGFGYNDRDAWIEDQVYPILECMGFKILDGKDMHGENLQLEVEQRIDQSDVVVGFLTIRDAETTGDFNSHLWVQNELVYGKGRDKPFIPVKEEGVKVPEAILGNVQYIKLDQNDRLACISELVRALGRKNMHRIKLEPQPDKLQLKIIKWKLDPNFEVRYRTQDFETGYFSGFRKGRLEVVNYGLYLNVSDVPPRGFVEIEGVLNGQITCTSGLASVDAVSIKIS